MRPRPTHDRSKGHRSPARSRSRVKRESARVSNGLNESNLDTSLFQHPSSWRGRGWGFASLMTACTSVASSGDSLFEGPSIPVDAPEFGCVAAQPANASDMITIAANGIAAASRLRSSRCTFLPSLRFTQHLFQSQRTSESEVIWLWQEKILPTGPHRHGSSADFARPFGGLLFRNLAKRARNLVRSLPAPP